MLQQGTTTPPKAPRSLGLTQALQSHRTSRLVIAEAIFQGRRGCWRDSREAKRLKWELSLLGAFWKAKR